MIARKNECKILIDYLNYQSSINKAKGTVKEYKYDLTNFLRYMKFLSLNDKKTKLEDITCVSDIHASFLNKIKLTDIYAYMAYLKNECNDSAVTMYRKVASIKSFFKYLHKMGIVKENIATDLELPKLGKRLPKYLTLEQSTELLYQIKNKEIKGRMHDNTIRDFAMATLFLNCGIRLSELVGIDIDHIKFDDSLLMVIGKGNKERTIYLNKACMEALLRYLMIRPDVDENALFLSERRTRISKRTVQQIIKDYLKKVPGLDSKYSTHKLRHTAATLMYQYGNVDIRTLQELLGHENLQTTEIYVHVDNEKVRLAVESNPLANYQ